MTETEIARKSELSNVLETISYLMEQLAVLELLPDDLDRREYISNRAWMYVLPTWSTLQYASVIILYGVDFLVSVLGSRKHEVNGHQ